LASSELYGYGGIFGLLERYAKASQPKYLGATVRYRNGQEYDVTNKTVFEGGETVTRWWLVNDSWAINWSLISWQKKDTPYLSDKPKSLYSDAKNKLKPKTDKALADETCKSKLNALLGKLKSKLKINELADTFYNNTDGAELFMTDKVVSSSIRGETPNNKLIILNRGILGDDIEPLIFFHELFHTTKKGGLHTDIAKEIAKIEGIGDDFKKYLKSRKSADQESSAIINSWVNKYCVKGNIDGILPWERVLEVINAK
jgi:hypothetical protein